MTTQFLDNNNELDPTMQKFLETQSQLLQGMTTQMINMGDNHSQGVCDNNDVKDDIIEGTQACNICGDMDHTYKEHEDQCPNCEEKRPTKQCPTSQVTCFLCEGNNHVPIQCPIYSIVQQRKQGGVQQQFVNPHEGTTSANKEEGKVKTMHHKAKSKVTTKCCYSCEEEGHISSNCPKKRERFPTFVVKYEEHELEELLALERPKKKKKCPNPSKKDITQEQCYTCKEMGHYANECPEKKKNQGNKQEARIPKEKKDISQVMCFNCKEPGHYASNCLEKMKHKINKPMKDLSLVTCLKSGNKGHYADVCPEKF